MSSPSTTNTWAIITAGGRSQRFNAGRTPTDASQHKLLQEIKGQSVLAWSVRGVLESFCIQGAVLTLPQGDESLFEAELQRIRLSFPNQTVLACTGGHSRRASVYAGLTHLKTQCEMTSSDLVVIHDGARPLLNPLWLNEAVETLRQHPDWHGVIAGHAVTDTLKQVQGSRIEKTVSREGLYAVQTPQVFRFDPLWQAHNGVDDGIDATDDAQLLELYFGDSCQLQIQASPLSNLKITTPEDLALARFYRS